MAAPPAPRDQRFGIACDPSLDRVEIPEPVQTETGYDAHDDLPLASSASFECWQHRCVIDSSAIRPGTTRDSTKRRPLS
jgi:hypothetical protein